MKGERILIRTSQKMVEVKSGRQPLGPKQNLNIFYGAGRDGAVFKVAKSLQIWNFN